MQLTEEQVSKIICNAQGPSCIWRADPTMYGRCGDCNLPARCILALQSGTPLDDDDAEAVSYAAELQTVKT